MSKTCNGSIPITYQPQGYSFTNGFWNVSRIEVSRLLRCAFIKVKPTKNHAFFVDCMTLKMKTLQSFDLHAEWHSVTQQNTRIFNNLDMKYHTPRISDMCLNSQQDKILKCFTNYLYTATLMIIHNSLRLWHKLTNTLYAPESNGILYLLQVAPGKMNTFNVAWKWLFEVSVFLGYGTVSLADWCQWSHLQGSKWSRTLWAFWPLKVRPLHWCKMSGTIYPEKWCHNPDTDLDCVTAKA